MICLRLILFISKRSRFHLAEFNGRAWMVQLSKICVEEIRDDWMINSGETTNRSKSLFRWIKTWQKEIKEDMCLLSRSSLPSYHICIQSIPPNREREKNALKLIIIYMWLSTSYCVCVCWERRRISLSRALFFLSFSIILIDMQRFNNYLMELNAWYVYLVVECHYQQYNDNPSELFEKDF